MQLHNVYLRLKQGCRQVGAWGGFSPPHFLSSNYTVYMGMAEIVKILSKMHLHVEKIHQIESKLLIFQGSG